MSPSARPHRFGRFVLDPVRKELRADGLVVPLTDTPYRILLALVQGNGAVITKEQLISRVWGRAVVGDNRLAVHINALRKLLGDGFIVTRPQQGYYFTAPPKAPRQKAGRPRSVHNSGNLGAAPEEAKGPWRLIGRSPELREISKRLAQGRLLTLTGPGGVGKTRLAHAFARKNATRYPDGVWLVELASLNDPDFVPGALATVLGINLGESASPLDLIARHIAQKKLLIVLDNCEHLIAGVSGVCTALLKAARKIRILATSRQSLGCTGEEAFEITPLRVPDESVTEPAAIRSSPAVQLFEERARTASSAFEIDDEQMATVARVCRSLDGLPLAIEIVAGWAGTVGLETLDVEFDGHIQTWTNIARAAPVRHSTLAATLEWSFGLLSPPERTVLCRLAVFAGPFSLMAAKAVAGDSRIQEKHVFEYVANLIRKSMIAVSAGGRQYRLLQTTRAFALEELAVSGEATATQNLHGRWVLNALETATKESESTSDAIWLARCRTLLEEVRTALDAVDLEPDLVVAIAGASWPLWRDLSLRSEGRRRLGAALSQLRAGTPAAVEANLRLGLGYMWLNTANAKASYSEFSRAVELFRASHERSGLASALAGFACAAILLGRRDEAAKFMAEALGYHEAGSGARTLAMTYSFQLGVAALLGSNDVARIAGEKALRLSETIGAERLALACAANLIELSFQTGDFDEAVAAARELVPRLRKASHFELLGFALGMLAGALTFRGDLDDALSSAREAAPLLQENAMLFWLFDHLALRLALAGKTHDAARVAGYADAEVGKLDRSRDPVGIRAMERIDKLLRRTLRAGQLNELKKEGALLTEEQVLALALSA